MGRPKGSPNKRPTLPAALISDAIIQLTLAVAKGEQWAVQEALKRVPIAMAEPIVGGVQEELLLLKIKEIAEFEARLAELEAKHDNS